MLSEVVLIITIAFSPGSSTESPLKVLEYRQPSMEVCEQMKTKVIATDNERGNRFDYHAICVSRGME